MITLNDHTGATKMEGNLVISVLVNLEPNNPRQRTKYVTVHTVQGILKEDAKKFLDNFADNNPQFPVSTLRAKMVYREDWIW